MTAPSSAAAKLPMSLTSVPAIMLPSPRWEPGACGPGLMIDGTGRKISRIGTDRGHRSVKAVSGLRLPAILPGHSSSSPFAGGDERDPGSVTPRSADEVDLCVEIPGPGTVEGHRFFWQMRIDDAGASGFVVVGVALRSFSPLGAHVWPGSSAGASWGYHGADGAKLLGGKGFQYADTFTSGDIIGIYLNLEHGSVTFAKNGVMLGTAFTCLPAATGLDYFPSVSLHDPGQSITLIDTDASGYEGAIAVPAYGLSTLTPSYTAAAAAAAAAAAVSSTGPLPLCMSPKDHRASHVSLSYCSTCSSGHGGAGGSHHGSAGNSRTTSFDSDTDGLMMDASTGTGSTTAAVAVMSTKSTGVTGSSPGGGAGASGGVGLTTGKRSQVGRRSVHGSTRGVSAVMPLNLLSSSGSAAV